MTLYQCRILRGVGVCIRYRLYSNNVAGKILQEGKDTTVQATKAKTTTVHVEGREYLTDHQTNVTPKILSHVGVNLHNEPNHPLSFIKQRIVQYFYSSFKGRTGNPLFTVLDSLHPVVTVESNFDSLLVPADHVSRSKNDCYYVNQGEMLRAHMTAHQVEVMRSGLNKFLLVGDVYRRDEIDSTHYPVFHQLDAVCLLSPGELLIAEDDGRRSLEVRQANGERNAQTQAAYTEHATALTGAALRAALEGLVRAVLGEGVEFRWVDAYFPFTHPSWELEIRRGDRWIEMLGCGVMEHAILEKGGCADKIGWAFGLGLERLAMLVYDIPDIRILWSQDSGFRSQFAGRSPQDPIRFTAVSAFPQSYNDLSFWVPDAEHFHPNDFYEVARETGGDIVEQVQLKDVFTDSKSGRTSHCYRVVYRHMERTLTKQEVNVVHKAIEDNAVLKLGVQVR